MIENFRKAINDPDAIKEQEKITAERIEKKFTEKHAELGKKIMQGTDMSLLERIKEMREKKDFLDLTDDEKNVIKQIKPSYNSDDKQEFYFGCSNLKFNFAKEIETQWSQLDREGFLGRRHHFQNWHQFCRLCIIEYDKVRYMEERIWHLYDMHLRHYKNAYFRFHEEELGETDFPSDFPRVSLLEQKSREFFLIHRMLLNNISFNSKKRGSSSAKPRGSIDWKKTIQMQSKGETTSFASRQNMRDFVTPENKLFVIAAYWMMHKADELMKNETIMFQEREALSVVRLKMKKII